MLLSAVSPEGEDIEIRMLAGPEGWGASGVTPRLRIHWPVDVRPGTYEYELGLFVDGRLMARQKHSITIVEASEALLVDDFHVQDVK
jgi:hypothetical protein